MRGEYDEVGFPEPAPRTYSVAERRARMNGRQYIRAVNDDGEDDVFVPKKRQGKFCGHCFGMPGRGPCKNCGRK